jgi:hypothetical protein
MTNKSDLEQTWIFDKIIGEQKCTFCYQKNVSRLKTDKQKIIDSINNNYQNYLKVRSEVSVKNIEYKFSDD